LACRASVRCAEAGHEIKSYPAKYQKKKQWEGNGESGNQGIVSGMIEAESLQHAPEAMTQVDRQDNKGNDIEEGVEEITQPFLDGNRDEHMLGSEGEAGDMNKKEYEDQSACIRHGLRGEGILDNAVVNGVSGVALFSILIKEIETDNDMGKENQQKDRTDDEHYQGVTVQFVGIALENVTAHKDGSVAG